MSELKIGRLTREGAAADIRISKRDNGNAITFSLSSELPVERFFGTEILSHDRNAIRLGRARSGAMPLLFNHVWSDPVGMVDGARVEDKRLVVDAHFFDTERAREVQKMIDGGLRNVSVGYEIYAVEERVKEDIYTAIDWEPLEASIVTVPADPTVGVGRSQDGEAREVRVVRIPQPAAPAASLEVTMTEQVKSAAAGASQPADIQVIENGFDPAKAEAARTATIRKLATMNDINDEPTVMHWIRSGKTWDAIADDILKVKEERAKASPAVLGLTPKETQRFSIVRVINALDSRNWSDAGFEAEVCRAAARQYGKQPKPNSAVIPLDILQRTTLQIGTAANGGYLVGTQIQPQNFIDVLRNRMICAAAGMQILPGLTGPITIPTQAAAGTAAWRLELGTGAASEMTVGQKSLAPKYVMGYQEFTRELMNQSSPAIENLVQNDLAAIIALKVDSAVLAGTSTDSSVPLGIRYTSGLGTANPTSGTAVNYADMIRFQSTVAASNALFTGFTYIAHPGISGLLMGKFTNATYGSTPLWEGALLDGQVAGRRAMSTVQVTSGTLLGGDFGQVFLGEFGSLEIETNPYANFTANVVGVRANYACDVLVRYGAAFAIGTGITG